MQFRLGTLLCLVTLVAVFCGIIFAAPLIVTAIVLCATMWLSPAVWISGASYASGGKQAFFRGGLICGILPFVAISSYGTFALLSMFDDWSELASSDTDLIVRLTLAGLWLTPGVFAFLGGTVGYVTYRLVTPRQEATPVAAPSLDYRVVSGRLTTQEAEISR
jgi:hypothetical protein